MTRSHTPENPNFVLFGGDNLNPSTSFPIMPTFPLNIPQSTQIPVPTQIIQNSMPNVGQLVHQLKTGPQLSNQLPIVTSVPLPGVIKHEFITMNPNSGTPIPPIANSLINPPITTKVTLPENTQVFNMQVSYKNQLPVTTLQLMPNLNLIENKLQNIDKLSNQELSDGIFNLNFSD
jgi:hypothetical protein